MSGPLSAVDAEVAGTAGGDGVHVLKMSGPGGGARTHILHTRSGWCGTGAVRCGRIRSPKTWCERDGELAGGPLLVGGGWLAGLRESRRSRRWPWSMGIRQPTLRATLTDCQAAKPRLAPKERP